MKINKTLAALIASASLGMSGQVLAIAQDDDTAAGTVVSNVTSLTYTVGDTDMSEDTSTAPTLFTVDQKVDLSLEWNQAFITADTGAEIAIKLTLSNEGNSVQSFKFDAAQSANDTVLTKMTGSGADKLDDADTSTASWAFYEESGDDVSGYDAQDTPLLGGVVENLAIDTDGSEVVTVWAVNKNADNTADESKIGVEIRARAWDGAAYLIEGNTNGSGNAAKNNALSDKFIMFAEGTGDNALTLSGGASRDGGFAVLTEILVAAPILTITKSVDITDDPISTSAPYYAIPGSTIKYTITVVNAGTGDAPTITVTDELFFSTAAADPSDPDVTTTNFDTSSTTGVVVYTNQGTDGSIDSSNLASSVTGLASEPKFTMKLELKAEETATITFNVILN